MNVKKLCMQYLSGYLIGGGLGFCLVPDWTLRIFGSNGQYGDVMPRLVGIFMLLLGGLVYQFVRNNDWRYFTYSVWARTGAFIAAIGMYVYARDPLFITLAVIVLIGLIPSIYSLSKDKQS
ncbi:MAG: hypothetical protein ACRCV6_08585 [Formosimonas sp.]